MTAPRLAILAPLELLGLSTQLGFFAKYWSPGRVKTRLAQSVGDACAADVARLFIENLLTRLQPIGDRRVVGFAPSEHRLEFEQLIDSTWRAMAQSDGDLGQRMNHYFESSFTQPSDKPIDRVVLLGADSPNLPLAIVDQAFEALQHTQLVLAPTDDGGYCLVGAREQTPPIFDDMPWSEPTLWEATLRRLGKLGWNEGREWVCLPAWYDVDTAADLDRLRNDLAPVTDDDALVHLRNELNRLLSP